MKRHILVIGVVGLGIISGLMLYQGLLVGPLLYMVVLLGVAFNSLAVYLNDGKMPVVTTRLILQSDERHKNADETTRVRWLCDCIRIPIPWLGATCIASVGDCCIVGSLLVQLICGFCGVNK